MGGALAVGVVKAAVACAVPADREPASLIAPRNVAHAIAPRPFLLIAGRHDEMCPTEESEQLVRSIGNPRSTLIIVEGTHKLRRDFVPHAVRWLKEHL